MKTSIRQITLCSSTMIAAFATLIACSANNTSKVTPTGHRQGSPRCRSTSAASDATNNGAKARIDVQINGASAADLAACNVGPANNSQNNSGSNVGIGTSASSSDGNLQLSITPPAATNDQAYADALKACLPVPPNTAGLQNVTISTLNQTGTFVLSQVLLDVEMNNASSTSDDTSVVGRIYSNDPTSISQPQPSQAVAVTGITCGAWPKASGELDATLYMPNTINAATGSVLTYRSDKFAVIDGTPTHVIGVKNPQTMVQKHANNPKIKTAAQPADSSSMSWQFLNDPKSPDKLYIRLTMAKPFATYAASANVLAVYTLEGSSSSAAAPTTTQSAAPAPAPVAPAPAPAQAPAPAAPTTQASSTKQSDVAPSSATAAGQ